MLVADPLVKAAGLTEAEAAEMAAEALLSQEAEPWQPNPPVDGRPNPQQLALDCSADELFYGGQAGGGKTDLLLGCAILNHHRAVIFRRTWPNLKAVIDRSIEILGEEGYHKTNRRHDLGGGRFLEFGYMQHEDDKKNWQGRPHDFYGFDEPTEMTRTQYKFVIGWLRTEIEGQRCRVILAGNPPIDQEGMWLVEEWAPWLDPDFPDPAEPGELRWYYHDEHGRLQWQKTAEPVEVDGKEIEPVSRTFIPATLEDNPHLARDGAYRQRLNSLPEPLRSAFGSGDFQAMHGQGDPFQVIPTEWVRAAQRRWLEEEQPERRPDGAGHDVARGGQDQTAYCERWGTYFGPVHVWPGKLTPDGPTAAKFVHDVANDPDILNVDIIGYGSSSYDSLVGMDYNAVAVNVGAGSDYTDKTGKLKMRNLRAELTWRMRDALDPEDGSDIALPPSSEVVADLCAPRYRVLAGGVVKVEDKDDIKKRLGRSPDVGDTLMLALYEPENRQRVKPVKARRLYGSRQRANGRGGRR